MRFFSTVTEQTEALMAWHPWNSGCRPSASGRQPNTRTRSSRPSPSCAAATLSSGRAGLNTCRPATSSGFSAVTRKPASNVDHYFVARDGTPTMLEPADLSSRAELERKQARKEQRRAEREVAAKERRRQLRAVAR